MASASCSKCPDHPGRYTAPFTWVHVRMVRHNRRRYELGVENFRLRFFADSSLGAVRLRVLFSSRIASPTEGASGGNDDVLD